MHSYMFDLYRNICFVFSNILSKGALILVANQSSVSIGTSFHHVCDIAVAYHINDETSTTTG